MTLAEVSTTAVQFKIIIFYILIFADIILNTFIELSFSTSLEGTPDSTVPYVVFVYFFIL